MQCSWDNLRYCRSSGECVRLLHLFTYTCLLLKMICGRARSMFSGERPGLSVKIDPGDIFCICVSLWLLKSYCKWFAKAKLDSFTVS